jgi:hypothetical protein
MTFFVAVIILCIIKPFIYQVAVLSLTKILYQRKAVKVRKYTLFGVNGVLCLTAIFDDSIYDSPPKRRAGRVPIGDSAVTEIF